MKMLNSFLRVVTIAAVSMSFAIQTIAEDTEIYQADASKSVAGRPKVLIIFDNSGSMGIDVELIPPEYDPAQIYNGTWSTDRIYWDKDDSNKYFPESANRCAESYVPLSTVGFFGGKLQRSKNTNDWNRWKSVLDNNGTRTATHVDCQADVINNNNGNGIVQADGYPCEAVWDVNHYYCTTYTKNIKWGKGRTMYTGNYLNYLNSSGTTSTKTRLEIATDAVNNIIDGNPAVDFGLALFNHNGTGYDGGRIVNRIIENSTDAQRTTLKNTIAAIQSIGWTPLCESTYEAYRYLAGLSLVYGDNASPSDTPGRDMDAETDTKVYKSPTSDCAYTYIILMTDGEPAKDTDANSAIKSLTGKTCQDYRNYSGEQIENCLPELAEYMATTDLDKDTTNGNQFAITYTIGFATDQVLLEDTARKGKGKYYTAEDSATLTQAFQSAITEIIGSNESFTSPAVAVDSFSRTESKNEIFFAMFEPSDRINWIGNIKRLNLVIENGEAVMKDKNGDDAFDVNTGSIIESAETVWSTQQDGEIVSMGGVGELLAARDPASRNLLSNTGSSDGLETFNSTHIDKEAYGFSTDAELFSLFGVTDQTDLTNLINWSRGVDVFDEDNDSSTTDAQEWILADMLHSKPLVVNYGARGSYTASNPDQRLVVGTNGGFLHMFGVDDGMEDWAFFPKELASIILPRQINAASTQHVYGIDASPTAYIEDGGDGTVSGSDTAYLYFGLRRGGRDLYALNISDPDSPTYLWKIIGGSGDFAELGQTWSEPVVTVIPGNTHDHDNDSDTPNIPKKVLIFGAGYDTNKDTTGVGTADSMGRGVYIVDATTGSLIRSITPGANSSRNIQETGLIHSVPSAITVVDSNADGLTDRLYFGDTGGNLWRVDMPGNTMHGDTDPNGDTADWYITQLAKINNGTTATDRRIFTAPDFLPTQRKVCKEYKPAPNDDVCIVLETINYDAVMVGTGDRTNPTAKDVDNQFYMFRDEQLHPYNEARPSSQDCTAAINAVPPVEVDFRCYLPLYTVNLADASLIAVSGSALESANGWKLDLPYSGEKVLSKALTVDGSIFFTTFSPNSDMDDKDLCIPANGKGRLYQVNLHNASAKIDFNNDGILDLSTDLGSGIPDTPSPHFGSDGKIRLLLSSGNGRLSSIPPIVGDMPKPYAIHWYREEF